MLLKTPQEIKQMATKVKKDATVFLKKKQDPDYILIGTDYEDIEYSLFQLLSVCLLDTSLFPYTNRIAAIIIREDTLLEYFLTIHTKSEIRAHITQEMLTSASRYTEFLLN